MSAPDFVTAGPFVVTISEAYNLSKFVTHYGVAQIVAITATGKTTAQLLLQSGRNL